MDGIQLSEVDPGCVISGMQVSDESALKLRRLVKTLLQQSLLVCLKAHNCLHSRSKAVHMFPLTSY